MLSVVAQALKACKATSAPALSTSPILDKTLKQVLDHAKTSGLADILCLSLGTSGSSLMAGSSNFLRAACEACRAIWLLIDAFEVFSWKENIHLFPLSALRGSSLHCPDIASDQCPLALTDSAKIVDGVTKAFLRSKPIQVAIYYCLHQRLEITLNAGVQVLLLSIIMRVIY